jgi:SsrA-binding protein
MPSNGKGIRKDIAVNRRARHDYFIEETFEAGLELLGTEVKAMREGKANLREGFVRIDRGEAWLENVHISQYDQGGYVNHEPLRRRKLLLHRREIDRIQGQVKLKGYTLIPLRIYFNGNWAKLEVGLARGKKLYDKRQTLAEQDARRQMERAVRER